MSARDFPQPIEPAVNLALLAEQIRALRAEMLSGLLVDRQRMTTIEAAVDAVEAYQAATLFGGELIGNSNIITAGVAQEWGDVQVVVPLVAVNIIAVTTGFVRNFTTSAQGNATQRISVDAASSWTAGGTQAWSLGGGGGSDNRKPVAVAAFVEGATVTGNVVFRVLIDSTHADTEYEAGTTIYAIQPA